MSGHYEHLFALHAVHSSVRYNVRALMTESKQALAAQCCSTALASTWACSLNGLRDRCCIVSQFSDYQQAMLYLLQLQP
jgi:hypothetical protein